MLNVIFYSPLKTKVEEEKVLQEDGTLKTTTVTTKYHSVRSLACNTMTHAKELFKDDEYLESFRGNLPSAQNIERIFCNTQIATIDGGLSMDEEGNEITLPADFSSVTVADNMCDNCTNLQSINIDLRSLAKVNNPLMECVSLTSFTGNLGSLQYGDNFFTSCSNLTVFNANLDSLVSGKKMFKYTKITDCNNTLDNLQYGQEMFRDSQLDTFTGTLPNLLDGSYMFAGSKLKTITLDSKSLLTGDYMLFNCTQLDGDINITAPSLRSAVGMLKGCASMDKLYLDAPGLVDAEQLCYNCTGLTSFIGDLTNVTNLDGAFYMAGSSVQTVGGNVGIIIFDPGTLNNVVSADSAFYRSGFLNWSIDMPKLENGSNMFIYSTGLGSFKASLGCLKDGINMFSDNIALTTFIGDLGALQNASGMFHRCKLSPQSVMYIVDTVKSHDSGEHSITIGINANSDITELNNFATEAGFISWDELKQIMSDKGWDCTWENRGGTVITI